jgi:hypothetical protein
MISTGLLQSIIGFAMYIGVILLSLRLFPRIEAALLVVILAMVIFFVGLTMFIFIGQTVNFWIFATGYWFLTTCFLMIFGAIYKSISLRILLELLEKPGRMDSYQDVFTRFVVNDSFQNRLNLIESKNLASIGHGGYVLTPKGTRIAKCARAIQRTFGITRSG